VLNPVVIPGLRAGTRCAVLRGSLLIVCKCVCHLCNKNYFTLLYFTEDNDNDGDDDDNDVGAGESADE